jgi:secondary thiamine-phosphate synthase enzyme
MIKELSLTTGSTVEFQNITSWVRREIQQSGVADGLCVVYVPHTTAAVTINESADPTVVSDIIAQTGKMVPPQAGYRHMEGNSAAHIKASLFGSSVTVIIDKGAPVLGTWQGIFFCEFDGPRSRKVMLTIMGEKHNP